MTPLSPALFLAALNALAAERSGLRRQCRAMLVTDRSALSQPERRETRNASAEPAAQLDLIHLLGFWAHYDHQYRLSSWPVPPVTTAAHLELFARKHGVLVDLPQPGDIYIAASRGARPTEQVGILTRVENSFPFPGLPAAMCHTARGVRGGPNDAKTIGVIFAKRCLTIARGDRFIRWADLDWRHLLSRRAAA